MEQNLWKATLTELAVLALCAHTMTHLYMRSIHMPSAVKVNMLDLGPLHQGFMDTYRGSLETQVFLRTQSHGVNEHALGS